MVRCVPRRDEEARVTPNTKRDESGLIDPVVLGKHVRAARVLAGHENIASVTARIRDELGVSVSDRTLYAIERGEQLPAWELVVALVLILEPPGGARFFWPSIAPIHVQRFMELSTESEAAAIARAAEREVLEATADITETRAR